jgi:hypothetical protein
LARGHRAGEAVRQDPAIEVGVEFAGDEHRQPGAGTLVRARQRAPAHSEGGPYALSQMAGGSRAARGYGVRRPAPGRPNGEFAMKIALPACLVALSAPLLAQTEVHGWGRHAFDSRWAKPAYVEVATGAPTGFGFTLGRRADGTAVAWGDNVRGQCLVPELPAALGFVQLSAGIEHSVGLLRSGQVLVWGGESPQRVRAVPPAPKGLGYVEVSAGSLFTLALRSDGVVVGWGNDTWGQCDVPGFPRGRRAVEIAAGAQFGLARLDDGSIVAWGDNARNALHWPRRRR